MTRQKNETTTDIELRSEGAQELMGRIPPLVSWLGAVIFAIVMLVALWCCLFAKIPETIEIDAVLSNCGDVSYVRSSVSGVVCHNFVEQGRHVDKGDTLMAIVCKSNNGYDTSLCVANVSGEAIACGIAKRGFRVEKEYLLYAITDTLSRHITGKGKVSFHARRSLRIGIPVEAVVFGQNMKGIVTDIAEYPNPKDGTFEILADFDGAPLQQCLICDKCKSKMRITVNERTLFGKFFYDFFNDKGK